MALKEKEFYVKHHIEIDENGVIRFEDKEKWEQNKANFAGKKADLILKKQIKDRSRQEEKYFHGVVCKMVAEEMGIAPQEAKEFLKELFLKEELTSPEGFRYERTMSTTELSDDRYRKFVFEECVRWAALPTGDDGLDVSSGLNIYIPEPNEIDYENM
jgi:hypothetical protein